MTSGGDPTHTTAERTLEQIAHDQNIVYIAMSRQLADRIRIGDQKNARIVSITASQTHELIYDMVVVET